MKTVRLSALLMFIILLLAMLVHSVQAVSIAPNLSVNSAYPYFGWTFAIPDGAYYSDVTNKWYVYGAGWTATDQFFIYQYSHEFAFERFINVTPYVPLGLTNVGGTFNGTHHYFTTYNDETKWFVIDDATGENTANITYSLGSCGSARAVSTTFYNGSFYTACLTSNFGDVNRLDGNGNFIELMPFGISSGGIFNSQMAMTEEFYYVAYTDNDVIRRMYRSNGSVDRIYEGGHDSTTPFMVGVATNGTHIMGGNSPTMQIFSVDNERSYTAVRTTFNGIITGLAYDYDEKQLYMGANNPAAWFGKLNGNGSRRSFDYNVNPFMSTNLRGLAIKNGTVYILDDLNDKVQSFSKAGVQQGNFSIGITGTLRTLHWDGNYFWIRNGSTGFRKYDENFIYQNFTIDTNVNHSGRGANGMTTFGEYGFVTLLGGNAAAATTGSAIALYNTTSGQYLGVELNVSNQSIYNALSMATNGTTLWVSEINNVGVGFPRVHSFDVQAILSNIPSPPVQPDTFPCDSGTLNDICVVNSTKNFDSGRFLNGTGSLLIKGTGSLASNASYGSSASLSINISGSITVLQGGSILTTSRNCISTCDSQPNAGAGGALTIIASSLYNNGTIAANGGTTLGFARFGGAGGPITIDVESIFRLGDIGLSASITSNGQGGSNQGSGSAGGIILINSSNFYMSNISSMSANGGNGQAGGGCSGSVGHRGSGGIINVTSQDMIMLGTMSAIRGTSGICNDGSDGSLTHRYWDILSNSTYSSTPFTTFIDMTPDMIVPALHITSWFPQSMDNLSFNDVPFNLSVNITADCELFINLSSYGVQTISPINTIVTHSTNTLNNGTFQYYYECETGGYFFNSSSIMFFVDEPFIPSPPANDTGNQTTTGGGTDLTPLVNILVTLTLLLIAAGVIGAAKTLKSPLTGIIGCFVLMFAAFSVAAYSPSIALCLILLALLLMWYFVKNGRNNAL